MLTTIFAIRWWGYAKYKFLLSARSGSIRGHVRENGASTSPQRRGGNEQPE